jgi:hypothetical protein
MVVPSLLSLILLGCFVMPLAAQRPDSTNLGEIRGQILDAETSTPISGVAVSVPESGISVITNAEGRFRIPKLVRGVYNLELNHIAYGVSEQLVNVPPGANVSVTLRISTKPIEFDPIEVTVTGWSPVLEQNGFFQRRKMGFGRFFTEEALKRQGIRTSLAMVPLLRMRQIGRSTFNYSPFYVRGLRACTPAIWVDGMQYRLRGDALGDFVDEFGAAAMEVYGPQSAPLEFQGNDFDSCGAIVIWTKRVLR